MESAPLTAYQSYLLGEYYRNLANNYYYYSLDAGDPRKLPWPDRPAGL